MAETYFPFDAGAGSSITEDQWRKMARFWLRTGILRGESNGLAPTANGSGMQVFVDTGRAFVEGHFYENDASKTLAIGAADPTNPRIDRVVLRLDTTANTIGLVVLPGTPAGSPAAPARSWGSTVYEFPVAQVRVDAAVVTIASGKVTDERVYANVGLDRIDFRTAVDAAADVDIRRTAAGELTIDGSLVVTGAVPGKPLSHVQYGPGSPVSYSTSAAGVIAVDTTNLRLPDFVAPASGIVRVVFTSFLLVGSATTLRPAICVITQGTTTVVGALCNIDGVQSATGHAFTIEEYITGLTPGTTYHWDVGWYGGSTAAQALYAFGGAGVGSLGVPFVCSVFAA